MSMGLLLMLVGFGVCCFLNPTELRFWVAAGCCAFVLILQVALS
jgi:hypothetical protein